MDKHRIAIATNGNDGLEDVVSNVFNMRKFMNGKRIVGKN